MKKILPWVETKANLFERLFLGYAKWKILFVDSPTRYANGEQVTFTEFENQLRYVCEDFELELPGLYKWREYSKGEGPSIYSFSCKERDYPIVVEALVESSDIKEKDKEYCKVAKKYLGEVELD